MSIKAQIKTDVQGNVILSMQGQLSFDVNIPLREELLELAQDLPRTQIIIDFKEIKFVGSSGIGVFVETINTLNKSEIRARLINVSEEFQKVFRLYKLRYTELTVFGKNQTPPNFRPYQHRSPCL